GRGLMGRPNPLARVGLETAQLAIAAHAVDVAVLDERRGYDAVQAVGFLRHFAGALAAPGDLGLLVAVELQHQRTLVERRHEEPVFVHARRRDAQANLNLVALPAGKRVRPEDSARGGIERVDGRGGPDNEPAFAGDLVDHGRRVAGLVGGQGAPFFLAGVLV